MKVKVSLKVYLTLGRLWRRAKRAGYLAPTRQLKDSTIFWFKNQKVGQLFGGPERIL